MTNIVPLRKPVDEDVIGALEGLLEMARKGELCGLLVLGNMPGEDAFHQWIGKMPSSLALLIFERWKLKVLLDL